MQHTPKRSTKFYRQNEAEVMKDLGLRPTKNSGAGWLEKEDGQSDHIIAQLKSTDKMSMSIKLDDINILEYNAGIAHKIPIFVIQFIQTNDVFIMARPSDLPGLHELIETGSTTIAQSIDIAPDEQQSQKPTKVIKSGNRDDFWAEKEREREAWKKK